MGIPGTLTQRLRDDQGGATAVVVGLVLLVLVGITGLAVDGTSIWTTRREIARTADAGALAGAVAADDITSSCADRRAAAEAAVQQNVTANNDNNDEAAVLDPGPSDDPDSGVYIQCFGGATKITVSPHYDQDLIFMPVLGFDSLDVPAASIAEVGQVVAMSGVMPLAVCSKTAGHYEEWTPDGWVAGNEPQYGETDGGGRLIHPQESDTNKVTYDQDMDGVYEEADGDRMVHRMYFDKHAGQANPDCDDSAAGGTGNWAFLDFTPSGGGNAELRDWIENGYDGIVTVDPDPYSTDPGWSTNADCQANHAGEDDCLPHTGANASTFDSFDTIRCPVSDPAPSTVGDPDSPCEVRWLVVIDAIYDSGAGHNTLYHPIDFLPVVLRDYEKFTGKGGYLDVEILFIDANGTVGTGTSTDTTKSIDVHLCGAEDTDNCDTG